MRELGMTREAAVMHFSLVPVSMRRGIALLGLIHRSTIGEDPMHFREYFERVEGSWRLHDYLENDNPSLLMRRSNLGLVRVYKTECGKTAIGRLGHFVLAKRGRGGPSSAASSPVGWGPFY